MAARGRRRSGLLVATVVGPIFLAGGIGLVLSVEHSRSQITPYPGGSLTVGKVVHVEADCGRGCSYRPIVRYSVGGVAYTITAPYVRVMPNLGEQATVSYKPGNAAAGRDVSEPLSGWDVPLFGGYFSAATGALFSIAAAAGWRRRLRTAPESVGQSA